MPEKCVIDKDAIWALILSLSSFIASVCYYGVSEAIKCLLFFPMYLVGLNHYYSSKSREAFLEKTLFSMFLGYALLVALTCFSNLSGARGSGNQWIIHNFWTGEKIATTLVGLLSSVVIGYSFYALVCQKRKTQKIIVALALITTMHLNIQTATRTPVVLFIMMAVLMTGIYLMNQAGEKAILSYLFVLCAAAACVIAVWFDAYGIRSYMESSPVFIRFLKQGLETSRISIAKEHCYHMWDGILGGNRIQYIVGKTAHNFIQQGYDLYGIFAGISLVALEISFIKNIVKLLLIKKKQGLDHLLISMYFSMIIQAHLEPIFTGYPCFFFSILLMHGMSNGYLRTRKTNYYENSRNQYRTLR